MASITKVRNTTLYAVEVFTTESSYTLPPRTTQEIKGTLTEIPPGITILGSINTAVIAPPTVPTAPPTFTAPVAGLNLAVAPLLLTPTADNKGKVEFDGTSVSIINATGARKTFLFSDGSTGGGLPLPADVVRTTSQYQDPSWIRTLSVSKLVGAIEPARGGIGFDVSSAYAGSLLIGNGYGLQLGDLVTGPNTEGVVVTSEAGVIFLDTVQDIRTTASPTFTGVTTDNLTINSGILSGPTGGTGAVFAEALVVDIGAEADTVYIGKQNEQDVHTRKTIIRSDFEVTGRFEYTPYQASAATTVTLGRSDPLPSETTTYDSGILFTWHDGVDLNEGFFGATTDNTFFSFIPKATVDQGLVTGDLGSIKSSLFVGPLSGNASTATAWSSSRTFTMEGAVTSSFEVSGASDVTIATHLSDIEGDSTGILHNYSSTPDEIPLAGDLKSRELFINIADGKVYFKDTEDTIISIVTTGGDAFTVPQGGSGVSTLGDGSGSYVKAWGTQPFTAVETIPEADIVPGGEHFAGITGSHTISADWTLSLTAAAPNSVTEYLTFKPTDYGVGNPALFIKKNTTATKWDLLISHDNSTVTTDGTLDIQTDKLTHNNATVWTANSDGAGSGLNADLLDSQQGSYYTNATNLVSGTIPSERVTGVYSSITQINFPTSTHGERLTLFGGIGNAGSMAIGTETTGYGTGLYLRSPNEFLWYTNTTADNGASPTMRLRGITGSSILLLGGNLEVLGKTICRNTNDQDYALEIYGDYKVTGAAEFEYSTTEVLDVADPFITLNVVSGTGATANDTSAYNNGENGIILKGTTDKLIYWSSVQGAGTWNSSENLNIPTSKTYRINDVTVLSSSSLGSSVTGSSLVSVGVLEGLKVKGVTGAVGSQLGAPGYEILIQGTGATYRVWHANNDGTGSGLDADLLDGQHGSYYTNYNNLSNKPTTLVGYGIDSQVVKTSYLFTALSSITGPVQVSTIPYINGSDSAVMISLSAFGRDLIGNTGGAAGFRSALGLTINSDVQAHNARLDDISGFTGTGVLRISVAGSTGTVALDGNKYVKTDGNDLSPGFVKVGATGATVLTSTITENDISASNPAVFVRVNASPTVSGSWVFDAAPRFGATGSTTANAPFIVSSSNAGMVKNLDAEKLGGYTAGQFPVLVDGIIQAGNMPAAGVASSLSVNDTFTVQACGTAGISISATGGTAIVDTFTRSLTGADDIRSAKYMMQCTHTPASGVTGHQYQVSELFVTHDYDDTFVSEYGLMYTGANPIVSFEADFVTSPSPAVKIIATALKNNIKIKYARMALFN